MNPKKSSGPQLFPSWSVPPLESDEQRMLKVAAGDVGAFKLLYERYKGPIVSYLIQTTGARGPAEEIAQEVFLRVYRHRESYTVQAKFTTWLWTIARNAALDHLRKKKEEPLLPEETMVLFSEDAGESPEAERALIEKSTRAAIEKCLGHLTDNQREALSLRTFSDMDYEEISGVLKLSLASVKSLLHRAKASLVDCLRGAGYGG